MKKIITVMMAILLIITSFNGCNKKQIEVIEKPIKTYGQSENQTPSPILTESPIPTPTPSQSPSPEPSPKEEELVIVNAYITTNTEEDPLFITENEVTTYANYARLHIEFNTDINLAIREYLKINGEQIEYNYVDIQDETITVPLIYTLPEKVVVTLNKGYTVFQYKLVQDYTYEFVHKPALKFDFSCYDSSSDIELPGAKLIMKDSQEFLYKFNKPVDIESLVYSSNIPDENIKVTWLSDTSLVLSVNNVFDGYNRISIDDISGKEQIYGNKLQLEGWLHGLEAGNFKFQRIPTQSIYAIVPENARIETLYEFDYGHVYNEMSGDGRFIELGLVTEISDDGLIYKKAILDLQDMTLETLEIMGKGIIPDEILERMILPNHYLFRGARTHDEWDNDGNMLIDYDRNIYKYSPAENTFTLLYEGTEDSYMGLPYEHLADGSFVSLVPDTTNYLGGGALSFAVISPAGKINREYETPFKMRKTSRYYYYTLEINEVDAERLLIRGYEHIESNLNTQTVYILDINDGSMENVTGHDSIMGYFADTELIVAMDFIAESKTYNISFISSDGEVAALIIGEPGKVLSEVFYNTATENFYFKQYDWKEDTYSLMIFNLDDNELRNSGIVFKDDFDIMGFDGSGKLLVMDYVQFTPN